VELAGKKGKVDNGALSCPAGISFCAATNRLYVCVSGNKRIVVYNALNSVWKKNKDINTTV
jgi:hypothetical protein